MHSPTQSRRGVCAAFATAIGLGLIRKADAATSPLVIGQSLPLTGPFADTADEMRIGGACAIGAANRNGGWRGRPLSLITLDDGYAPDRSLENAQLLQRDHGAIALLSPLGFPTTRRLAPWAHSLRIPIVGARSGANVPDDDAVFYGTASFEDELRFLMRHQRTLGRRRIALMVMGGPTGDTLEALARTTASENGLILLKPRRFDEAAQYRVAPGSADAVLIAGGGKGAVQAVTLLLGDGWQAPSLIALSLVQPRELSRALGARIDGMGFSVSLPSPLSNQSGLARAYISDLQEYDAKANATSLGLEGYLAARILLRAVAAQSAEPTGGSLIDALLHSGRFDIQGFPLRLDPKRHRASDFVDLAVWARNGLRL